METIQEKFERQNENLNAEIIKLQNQIEHIKTVQVMLSAKTAILASLNDKLHAFAKKQGLEIGKLTFFKTGPNSQVWAVDDVLDVSLNLFSTGKFKFIKFAGYTANGAGRNNAKLEAKAEKLKEKFLSEMASTFIKGCFINKYSLEESKNKNNDQVLLSFYL